MSGLLDSFTVPSSPPRRRRTLRAPAIAVLALAFAFPLLLPTSGQPEPWAWKPLHKPPVPVPVPAGQSEASPENPIDAFVHAALADRGLTPSPPADGYTLARRAWIDLLGLLPTPAESQAFVRDSSPEAWERLVDRLLSSPRHGERWARHWMDTVHFAETHGHDEDVIRENAWPYRDFLIGAFNSDMPYARFARLQIAGDRLEPGNPSAIVATGFLAAGPWDQSSQMGIQDGAIDKEQARYVDRDDMLTNVSSTFLSTSVHCARCHDHKFDPVSQEDYYALQAVFAGIDRVDRSFDRDPVVHQERLRLLDQLGNLESGSLPDDAASDPLVRKALAELETSGRDETARWNVLKPETARSEGGAVLTILEDGSVLSTGLRPDKDLTILQIPMPPGKLTALRLEVLTDPQLPQNGPGRQDNGNFHLSEFEAGLHNASLPGVEVPLEFQSAAADFDQDGWTASHAIDGDPATAWGIYPAISQPHQIVFRLPESIDCPPGGFLGIRLRQEHGGGHLIGRVRLSASSSLDAAPALAPPEEIRRILAVASGDRSAADRQALLLYAAGVAARRALDRLPPAQQVYAVATQFEPRGNFRPAGGCRPVHFLVRGDIHRPGPLATPGALSSLPGLPGRFALADSENESARRAALAEWITHPDNPLFWRSAVNRVWQYHFGTGLVSTANDFGELGERPSHPELLDWLAVSFRESGGSLRWLHRLILTSATYRQASFPRQNCLAIDADNRLLWRMSPLRLESECLRDGILQISGNLDFAMGGPSARQFLTSAGVHMTPVVDYLSMDPASEASRRRSVYRFLFRTLPDPFHQALDCPDASQLSPRRSSAATVQQALALLHDRFVVHQADQAAARLGRDRPHGIEDVARLLHFAWSRPPTGAESESVAAYADAHGLANACRIIFNSNEFLFRP